MLKYVAVFTIGFATAAAAQQQTVQQQMPFEACLQSIQQASANLSAPPQTTVDTPDKREVVMTVPDGKVTVTCDGANQQATMTHQR